MDYSEHIVRHINGYKGLIIDVTVDQVELFGGSRALREVVHHPGGVAIVALDDKRRVCCVRQYRYPFGRQLLEIPAGKLEKNEEPLPAAVRELSEETGVSAAEITALGEIFTSPGFSTEVLYLYLARGLTQGAAHPDDNEFLDVEWIGLERLCDMVMTGEIKDAKTVVAVLKTKAFLEG